MRSGNAPEVFNVLPVPESEAIRIAIAEVKKREGWSGLVDESPVQREGIFWYVAVWHTPAPHRPSEDRRRVIVDGEEGKVLKYGREGQRTSALDPGFVR